MDDIILAPVDDAVAIGMPPAEEHDVDRIAIAVDADALPVSDDRQCDIGRGRSDPIAAALFRAHPRADVVMGEDGRAALAEMFVAAGMIAVPVRVDDMGDGRSAKLGHRRFDLGR